MNFFDGLYSYEIVLLVMGGLLFLVALGKLIFSKPTAVLGVYFVISISMVAYPSVQSIDYKDGLLSIKNKVHELESNPDDPTLRASLQQEVAKIQERPSSQPESRVAIAQAHFALGNEAAAQNNLEAVLQNNPELPEAKDLKQKIVLSNRLKTLSSRVAAAPDDTTAKQQLNQAATEVIQSRVANPAALQNAKRAQELLKTNPVSPIQPNPVSGQVLKHKAQFQKLTPTHLNNP
jgi:hypothetical protein